MLDMQAWIRRAQEFVRGLHHLRWRLTLSINIQPPSRLEELSKIEDLLSFSIPSPLRQFYLTASRSCKCHYSWRPEREQLAQLRQISAHEYGIYGGPSVIALEDLPEVYRGWADYGSWWEDDEYARREQDIQIWRRCFPFHAIANGDYLALDMGPESVGSVVYLSHDSEPATGFISPNFESFLNDWEQIRYIGPECWLLRIWQNDFQGPLDINRPETKQIQELLAWRN